jgi:chromosome segregation ATPase
VQFLSSSLRHAVAEKTAVREQIAEFTSSVLPDLWQQAEHYQRQCAVLEARILAIQAARSTALIQSLDSPDTGLGSLALLAERSWREIDDLTAAELDLKANAAETRAKLRAMQDQFLRCQRERSIQGFDDAPEERALLRSRQVQLLRPVALPAHQNRRLCHQVLKAQFVK